MMPNDKLPHLPTPTWIGTEPPSSLEDNLNIGIVVKRVDSHQQDDGYHEVLICLQVPGARAASEMPRVPFGTPTVAELGRWLIAHGSPDKLAAACEISQPTTQKVGQ